MGLVYAHRPGIAQLLNPFMAELVRAHPQVVGLGTVLPGEPNAADIVKEAIDVHKLRGIKLHCHVQKVAIDSPQVLEVLEICQQRQVPAIVHAGREPASRAYGVQTHEICGVDRTRRVLQRLPGLRLLIPHLGADEFSDYFRLLADHEHLYLDTAMACADYFAYRPEMAQVEHWAGRIVYGTDFPIIPYEVDRELRVLARRIVADDALQQLLRGTAQTLWPS